MWAPILAITRPRPTVECCYGRGERRARAHRQRDDASSDADGIPRLAARVRAPRHSGYYGIVNSEEGYQSLVRFLFGDVRADGRLEIDELTLPPAVQAERAKGKQVRASYLVEVSVSARNKPWQLHRRTADENSAILRKFDELFPSRDPVTNAWLPDRAASASLFNVFLDMGQSQTGTSLAFAADVCVLVTECQVDGALFFKNYFEGGYLFRDMVTLETTMPARPHGACTIAYQFVSQRDQPPKPATITRDDEEVFVFEVPIEQPRLRE